MSAFPYPHFVTERPGHESRSGSPLTGRAGRPIPGPAGMTGRSEDSDPAAVPIFLPIPRSRGPPQTGGIQREKKYFPWAFPTTSAADGWDSKGRKDEQPSRPAVLSRARAWPGPIFPKGNRRKNGALPDGRVFAAGPLPEPPSGVGRLPAPLQGIPVISRGRFPRPAGLPSLFPGSN